MHRPRGRCPLMVGMGIVLQVEFRYFPVSLHTYLGFVVGPLNSLGTSKSWCMDRIHHPHRGAARSLEEPFIFNGLSYPIHKAPDKIVEDPTNHKSLLLSVVPVFPNALPVNPRSPTAPREAPPVPWRITSFMMSLVKAALDSSRIRPPNPVM